jgi:uncharacterized membrane protein YdbT with pleckstrin-like domain
MEWNLLTGEKIVWELKPSPLLRKYFFWSYFMMIGFFLFFVLMGMVIPILFEIGVVSLWIPFVVVIFFWFLFRYIAKRASKNYMYWVTNKRIVAKSGVFGYKINSIPFERISDVTISRSWLENFVGIASLHIHSLAGGSSVDGALLGVLDPEKLSKEILDLVRSK